MTDIFTFLLINLTKFGKLSTATFYENEFAQIILGSGDKKYIISVRCEGDK